MSSPERIVINANGRSVCPPSNQVATASPGLLGTPSETLKPPQTDPAAVPPRASTLPPIAKAPAPQMPVQNVSDVLDNAAKAVVYVDNAAGDITGSGFIIPDDIRDAGYIVTNAHVVANFVVGQTIYMVKRSGKDVPALSVKLDKDEELLPVELIAFDYRGADLALLRIKQPPRGLKSLRLAQSEPKVGEPVYTIGSPFGTRGDSRSLVASGIISGTSGTQVVTNAEINPGNSGGPLLNSLGEVVGVARAYVPDKNKSITGIYLAVRVGQVKTLLDDVRDGRFAIVAQQEGRNADLKKANREFPLLAVGSPPVSGRIDQEDLDNGNEVYEFAGTAGQKITIEVQGDGGFVPSVVVEQVREDEVKPVYRDSARPKPNSTIAKLVFPVPETGKYRLTVNPLKTHKEKNGQDVVVAVPDTGTYKLTIR